jgi:phosphoglycolate phosphatase-like HAD superfamily hydrolase
MPLIAFDLDGVLYSSEAFLGEAYRESIANVNRRRPGSFSRIPATREILDHVGWPVSVILSRLFPRVDEEAMRLISTETLDVICARVSAGEGRLYPDVPATLHRLQASGHVLAVASNGRARYVEAVLETHGIAELFVERETSDRAGSKAAVLRAYLDRLEASARDMVMVGDRASDVEAAKAVGCRFVGCDYGHGYRAEVEGAGQIVRRFADLPDVVAVLVGAA